MVSCRSVILKILFLNLRLSLVVACVGAQYGENNSLSYQVTELGIHDYQDYDGYWEFLNI